MSTDPVYEQINKNLHFVDFLPNGEAYWRKIETEVEIIEQKIIKREAIEAIKQQSFF